MAERKDNPNITSINLGLARVIGVADGESKSSMHFALRGLGITGLSVHFANKDAALDFLQIIGSNGSLRLQIVEPTIRVGIDSTDPPRRLDRENGFLPGTP